MPGKKLILAEAKEDASVVKLQERYGHFINGKFVGSRSKKYFKSINPATEKVLASLSEGTEQDIDVAVRSAQRSYSKYWSVLNPSERGKYLFRIARIIQEKAREFAIVESLDGGKPVRESRDVDIPLAAAHFFYYAGWADKLSYVFSPRKASSIGVAGQIVPWNFPLLMAAWKIAPALATGNTVVLKPAETTSLTAMLLADVIKEAELPPGVVNIVTGGPKTGQALVQHKGVNKIAFTGSTEVGRSIQNQISSTNKKCTLELGGKSANIIFEDAPIDEAIEGIINGIFFNQGHVCCAGSRLLVQEPVYDTVIKKLKDRMQHLKIGDPLDKNTDIGAINSKFQLKKITELCERGIQEKGIVYQQEVDLPSKGYWFRPTLFTHVSQSSSLVQEEIFGPVLTIQTFRTVGEAVTKANNTPYGLSAGIWTDKGAKAQQVSAALRAGVVWTNSYNKFDPTSPFGGYKESGFGREGGLHGLFPYINLN
jgi:aldehyde dehydrogenase (NAD+)